MRERELNSRQEPATSPVRSGGRAAARHSTARRGARRLFAKKMRMKMKMRTVFELDWRRPPWLGRDGEGLGCLHGSVILDQKISYSGMKRERPTCYPRGKFVIS